MFKAYTSPSLVLNTSCFITAKSRPPCLIQNSLQDFKKICLFVDGWFDWTGIFISQWFHSALQSFFFCGDSMAIYLTRYSMAFCAVFTQQSALAVWLFGCPVTFVFWFIINTLRAPINRLWECGLVFAPEISISAVLEIDFGKLLKEPWRSSSCDALQLHSPSLFP